MSEVEPTSAPEDHERPKEAVEEVVETPPETPSVTVEDSPTMPPEVPVETGAGDVVEPPTESDSIEPTQALESDPVEAAPAETEPSESASAADESAAVEPDARPSDHSEPAAAASVEPALEGSAPDEVASVEPAPEESAASEPAPLTPIEEPPTAVEPTEPTAVAADKTADATESTAVAAADPADATEPQPEPAQPTDAPQPVEVVPPTPTPTPTAAPEPVVMQVLGGIITAISSREIDLTLDDGRAAVIHRENFDLAETDPTTVLQVGDGAEGAVLSREDPQDRVVLSRKWVMRERAWKKAAECVEDHSTLNVKVTSVSRKGVVVDVLGLRGFVPLNHFQLAPTPAPPADLVGQMVELRVIAADRQKDKLLLSRRSALMKEQRKAEAEALQNLKVGSVYTGTVVDLTQFGAFVEVGEPNARVRGLLHVSEMSWERINSPKGHVAVGDEIEVKVIEVKVKKKRVSLSRKELIDDPLAAVEVGSVHTGKVKRLVDYGVFVDIGIAEGMVHLSELAEYRPSHPSEVVLRGDEVQVKVLKVNRQKRRVELSIRQALYPS